MASAWPNTLPQQMLTDSFTMGPRPNAIAFAPELGPPMMRRRGTSAPTDVTGDILLTVAQWSLLLAFFQTTLKETDIFTWINPITLAAVTCKFAGPPVIKTVTTGDNPYVVATLAFMILY